MGIVFLFCLLILWNLCTEGEALNGGRSQDGNENSQVYTLLTSDLKLLSTKALWSSGTLPEVAIGYGQICKLPGGSTCGFDGEN